jgi:transposase
LYLSPPEHALVLCCDEKRGIQALDRRQRNGMTTLFTALSILDGQTIGQCQPGHTHGELLAFLKKIDRETPRDSTQDTGRSKKLTAMQERQVFRWINGKNPMQYQLDATLGSRKIVGEMIQREFGVTLSLASVGALLARLGLSPQKPLQRAYQRDPEAIERWQRESYPALARQAREERAEILFWDESGFRPDAVQGKTWGVKGASLSSKFLGNGKASARRPRSVPKARSGMRPMKARSMASCSQACSRS